MKKIFMFNLLVSALVLTHSGVFSQITENFNTRPEALNLNQIKPYLQSHCWQLADFDANLNGWNPGIEGDAAMVSGPSAVSTQRTGIFSPVFDAYGDFRMTFKYKFDSHVTSRRWFSIYLTDASDNILYRLDSVELTNQLANTVYTYDQSLRAGSGNYKVYINYRGEGGATRVAIDEIFLTTRLTYASGCNSAPVAVDDIVPGSLSRTANGMVTPNDYDDNGNFFTANLITGSPDGTVALSTDGSFTFTPNPGFTGNSTTFTYNICDVGSPILCSELATVTITFPSSGALPVTFIDLKASYDDDNKVMISWTTTFESNSDHFEVERSTDGLNFTTVGSVKAVGNSGNKNSYSFADNIKSINTSKKDIYYRVKQVDKDSKSAVTKVLIVRVYKSRAVQMISVTPNPVVNNIRVNMGLNETSMVVIKLANNAGSELMRKNVRATAGNNSIELEGTAKLAAGVYIMEVIVNSNERMTIKLVKN